MHEHAAVSCVAAVGSATRKHCNPLWLLALTPPLLENDCALLPLLHVDTADGTAATLHTLKQLHYTATAGYTRTRRWLANVVMMLRHHYWSSAHHDGVPPWCKTPTRCPSQPHRGQFLHRRLRQRPGLYARQVSQPVREGVCRSCDHARARSGGPLATTMCGLLLLLRRRRAGCLCIYDCTTE